jgi:GxxExxY protein
MQAWCRTSISAGRLLNVIALNAFKGKKKKMQKRTASRPFTHPFRQVVRKIGFQYWSVRLLFSEKVMTEEDRDAREQRLNAVSYVIIGCAIKVHRALGPGLLEKVYQKCLVKELRDAGLNVDTIVPVTLFYKGESLGTEYFIDILVEDEIILELKAVGTVVPIHEAQTLGYLKLAQKPLGFLINFNVEYLKDGLKRIVNGL